jgi:hypothetical protein
VVQTKVRAVKFLVLADIYIRRENGGACCWDLQSQLYVLSGFLIRENKIRFTSGCATGLKIQRIQELGSQIPVTARNFNAFK